jgi:thioredoxin 1
MADSIIFYDFWAAWCGPCKVMHPIIEEIEKEYEGKVTVKKINLDEPESQELTLKYPITAVPTYIIEKNGQVIQQFIGAQHKNTITEALDQALST